MLWTLGSSRCFCHFPTLLRHIPAPRPPSTFHIPHSTFHAYGGGGFPSSLWLSDEASWLCVTPLGETKQWVLGRVGDEKGKVTVVRMSSEGHCLPRARVPPCPVLPVDPPSPPLHPFLKGPRSTVSLSVSTANGFLAPGGDPPLPAQARAKILLQGKNVLLRSSSTWQLHPCAGANGELGLSPDALHLDRFF